MWHRSGRFYPVPTLIVLLMLCRARSEADARLPIASTESDGARELSSQRIDVLFRLLSTLDVSRSLASSSSSRRSESRRR